MTPFRSPIPETGHPLHPDALISADGEILTFEAFAAVNADALDAEDLHWLARVLASDGEAVLGGGAAPAVVIELVGRIDGRIG